jgi:hypothetical protein
VQSCANNGTSAFIFLGAKSKERSLASDAVVYFCTYNVYVCVSLPLRPYNPPSPCYTTPSFNFYSYPSSFCLGPPPASTSPTSSKHLLLPPAPTPSPAPRPTPAPTPPSAPTPTSYPKPTPAPKPSPAPKSTPAPTPSPAPTPTSYLKPTPAPKPSPAPKSTRAPTPTPAPTLSPAP